LPKSRWLYLAHTTYSTLLQSIAAGNWVSPQLREKRTEHSKVLCQLSEGLLLRTSVVLKIFDVMGQAIWKFDHYCTEGVVLRI
jgi:hypothetical protein